MKTQQYDLYRAEAAAREGVRFNSLDELEAWLHSSILDTWWFPERHPEVSGIAVPRVHRRDGEGSVGAFFEDDGSGQIEMHPDHWCAKYVCHEVAHVLAAPRGSSSHDPTFARIYLELVYLTMGSDAYVDLHDRFTRAGIDFSPRVDNT